MKRFFTLLTLLLLVSLSLFYTDFIRENSTSQSLRTTKHIKTITSNPEYASLIGVKLFPIEKASFIN